MGYLEHLSSSKSRNDGMPWVLAKVNQTHILMFMGMLGHTMEVPEVFPLVRHALFQSERR